MFSSVLLFSLMFSAATPQIPTSSDTPKAMVSGVVTDRFGHPLAWAEVRLINSATGEVVSARSDKNGSYRIKAGDPSADYTFAVRRIGFAPELRTGLHVDSGEGNAVSFALDSLKVKYLASRAAERKKK